MTYFDTHDDSPFADAFRAACDPNVTLAVYSIEELSEFESCAYSLLNRPAYENDVELLDFRDTLHDTISARFVDEPDDAAHHNH